jgi:hypothetical protein
MSVYFWAYSIASKRWFALWRFRPAAGLTAVALLIQGCAPIPPRPFQGANAADPAARVRAMTYRPVLGTYTSQRPVDPASWRERNERVAPAPKLGGQ